MIWCVEGMLALAPRRTAPGKLTVGPPMLPPSIPLTEAFSILVLRSAVARRGLSSLYVLGLWLLGHPGGGALSVPGATPVSATPACGPLLLHGGRVPRLPTSDWVPVQSLRSSGDHMSARLGYRVASTGIHRRPEAQPSGKQSTVEMD